MQGKTSFIASADSLPRAASMRPPRNAGENQRIDRNEIEETADASMRPPRNAGENSGRATPRCICLARFNEAPAKCRGKRPQGRGSGSKRIGFNEAPAKCRGKRPFLIGKITMSKIRKMRDLGRFAHFATYQHHLTIST